MGKQRCRRHGLGSWLTGAHREEKQPPMWKRQRHSGGMVTAYRSHSHPGCHYPWEHMALSGDISDCPTGQELLLESSE